MPTIHSNRELTDQRYDRRADAFRWATTVLKVVIVVLAVKAVHSGPEVWVFSGIFTAFFTLVPTLLRRYTGVSVPWLLEFLLFLAMLLHVGGGALGVYDMWGPWDMVTHFVSTLMLAIFGITLVLIANGRWGLLRMTPGRIVLVTMVVAMALGLVWEGMEWAADGLFDIRAQDGVGDTLSDLVMDAVGGMAAALLAVRWMGDGTMARMTGDVSRALWKDAEERSLTSPRPVTR